MTNCKFFRSSIQHQVSSIGSKGVALIQGLVMVNIIALTAAAMMVLSLGTATESGHEKEVLTTETRAEAALALVYNDLNEVLDRNGDGVFEGACGVSCRCSVNAGGFVCQVDNYQLSGSLSFVNGEWTGAVTAQEPVVHVESPGRSGNASGRSISPGGSPNK
ncbi:MAG: hypothetical protein HY401_09275 [Elusimicrobia bacterium]|nr:hypothetical protein [Elusimicrobiota bacterium]